MLLGQLIPFDDVVWYQPGVLCCLIAHTRYLLAGDAYLSGVRQPHKSSGRVPQAWGRGENLRGRLIICDDTVASVFRFFIAIM